MALAFLLLFLASAGLASLGVLGLLGRLPRNSWAGIRLPYTMASDERWYDTHRGAGPILVFGGVAIAAVNLSFLPFAIFGRISGDITTIVAIVSVSLLLLVVLQAAFVGVRYAQAREE
jgi:uncharacterized membrane protein